MKDEYDKIIELFSLESKEKEKRLDEIFSLSIAFIEKYKHIQHDGSEEERKAMTEKLITLKEKIAQESRESEESLSLTKEEIKDLSQDEKNFTPEQWELLQKTKKALSTEKKELETKKHNAAKEHLKKAGSKKRRRTKRGGSSWLKS